MPTVSRKHVATRISGAHCRWGEDMYGVGRGKLVPVAIHHGPFRDIFSANCKITSRTFSPAATGAQENRKCHYSVAVAAAIVPVSFKLPRQLPRHLNCYIHVSETITMKSYVSNDCAWAYVSDIFFNGTAKTLVIYGEFRYISRIFPTLFSKLISIFIFLLNTFSMGEKTRARLTQERTVRLHYAQWRSFCLLRHAQAY